MGEPAQLGTGREHDLAAASRRVTDLVRPERAAAPRVATARFYGGAALPVAAFLGTVLLGALGVHRLLADVPTSAASDLRAGEQPILATKRDWFREHGGEIDVVFLGSSRVYREVDPQLLEEEAAARGLYVSTFNFGVPGMNLLETLAQVEWMLDRRPAGLEALVVELQPLDPPYLDTNAFTERQVAWHTLSVTRAAVEVVLASDRTPGRKLADAAFHLRHLALHLANAGRAFALLEHLREGGPRLPRRGRLTGYLSLDEEAGTRPELLRKHERFLRQSDRLEGLVAALRAEPAVRPLPEAERRVLARTAERARAAGVELVYVLMPPTWERQGEYLAPEARAVLGRVLVYNDPDAHPELYALENLYGFDHLNRRGAELFTRELARDLAERLSEGGGG